MNPNPEMEGAGAEECDVINHPPMTVRYVTVFFPFNVGTFGHFREGNSVIPPYGHETMEVYKFLQITSSNFELSWKSLGLWASIILVLLGDFKGFFF